MKNFNKLSLAVLIIGATLIVFSFIPDLESWKEIFSFKMEQGWQCRHFEQPVTHEHYHWNYKGWVWFLTGLALFIIQVARVIVVFKDKDFTK